MGRFTLWGCAAWALSCLTFGSAASAQDFFTFDIHRLYVEGDGGAGIAGTVVDHTYIPKSSSREVSGLHSNGYGDALVGYSLTPVLAIEGEGLYTQERFIKRGGLRNLQMQTYGGLVNLKASVPVLPHLGRFGFVPYAALGVGYGDVGYSKATFPYASGSLTHSGLLAQGRGGVEITTGTPISIDIGYRYLRTPEYEARGTINGGSASDDLRTHVQAMTAGIRYTF
jgi:opacity protein-like surface antigen